MNILIAADGSPFTGHVLDYLAAHDEWLGPKHRYTVLTVTPALPPHVQSMVDRKLAQDHYGDTCEAVFQPIRSFFAGHGIDATYIAQVGHAAEEICKVADQGRYDLLLLGSHGHRPLVNLVLGSTVTQVLAGCKTPVLLIR